MTATAHARAGRIDQAAHLALQALEMARRIRSRRVTARITLLAHALAPHRPLAEVTAFLEHLPQQIGQGPAGKVPQG